MNRVIISASEFVSYRGWPPDEGIRLAQAVLEVELDPDISWSEVMVDVSQLRPDMLISAFFRAFLGEIERMQPTMVPLIRQMKWHSRFEFQRQNIERWMQ